MPDILKVTTPLPGTESTGKVRNDAPRQQQQQVIQTVTDPKTVGQANSQTVYTEQEANKFLPNYESNYEMFLELLRLTPDAMEEIRTLIFSKMGQMVSSGIETGMAEEMATFMDMLQMNEAELLQFVKSQLSGAVKFTGPFFDLLRSALSQSASHELREAVTQFLKSYDGMSSTQHILEELHANLESIAQNMPKSMGDQLLELAAQLPEHLPNGQTGEALVTIRESVLPFLARYMNAMHDFGPARDFITMFVLNTARFETGSMENFVQSLNNLLTFGEVAERLPEVNPEAIARALVNGTQDPNQLATQFARVLARGMEGSAGIQNKGMFENIVRALLVNESVYMPLLHAMIPADVNGTLLYSEVWVDPDAEEGYEGDEYERAIKMLVKFDIKNVGCFDLVLLHVGGALDIQLYTPKHLVKFEAQIAEAIAEIAQRNELSIHSFAQQPAVEPKTISEVFPKLYERKNAINVVI